MTVNIASLDPEAVLRQLFDKSVEAASAGNTIASHLPEAPSGRTVVVGAGKAAASMAHELEKHWQGHLDGLVVTRYQHGLTCKNIDVVEASHPVPDSAGQNAARQILSLTEDLTSDDLVICLISGGASSLLSLPADGVSHDDKKAINRALLKSGATISEINTVRKHLSAIKGGRLGVHCHPARVVTLMISDVPGDDPSVIGSGPTVADASTLEESIAVLDKYEIQEPAAVVSFLKNSAEETPKPGDPKLANTDNRMLATPQDALQSAAREAQSMGITPIVLGDTIEGESRDIAQMHASIARQIKEHDQPLPKPCVILSGGETTVTVRGNGRGGRNAEFLLALTLALDGMQGVYALACDTDGIDGTEDNAGALCGPNSLKRAEELGLDARGHACGQQWLWFF